MFYHKNRKDIDNLLKKHQNKNSNIEIHQVDLLDRNKLEETMKQILKNGNIDAVVHSVTLPIENKSIFNKKWEDFQLQIELQIKSLFHIIHFLLPSMKTRKQGKIVNIITSYVVGRPPTGISDYIIGKYSLLGLTKALAVELGQFGITVNGISPSLTNTPLTEKLPSKLKEINASQVPLGRLAEPQDVASAALFLCSKYSDFVSGENFLLTGGSTMY